MKDLKISKELLSEVLKLEVVKHSLFNKSNSSFNITYMQSEDSLKSSWMPINIYEFVFIKCKEWVLKQGYRIIIDCSKDIKVGIRILKNGRDIYSNENKSEVEAVIKASEYILKETK